MPLPLLPTTPFLHFPPPLSWQWWQEAVAGGGHKLAERNKTDRFSPQERHEQRGDNGLVNKGQFGPGLRVSSLWARLPGLTA